LLFRIADIIKPFPANRLERLPGGLGIMADDAMAGVYANLALQILRSVAHVIPRFFGG
jgi:phosphatidylglycerophosphatase A